MEIWQYAILFLIGIVVGFVNVMAGGGSLLTLPVMLFLGVPGPVANGTNR
ncbi:MAG: sulfite exporter TauE/SafE family protein, partial [Gammaproteobacteria bacterium]|nr:sulfite exporter TauE/SafE family protein [Gammaproteobacteria bacterium]